LHVDIKHLQSSVIHEVPTDQYLNTSYSILSSYKLQYIIFIQVTVYYLHASYGEFTSLNM